jgi:hypothetical protein
LWGGGGGQGGGGCDDEGLIKVFVTIFSTAWVRAGGHLSRRTTSTAAALISFASSHPQTCRGTIG